MNDVHGADVVDVDDVDEASVAATRQTQPRVTTTAAATTGTATAATEPAPAVLSPSGVQATSLEAAHVAVTVPDATPHSSPADREAASGKSSDETQQHGYHLWKMRRREMHGPYDNQNWFHALEDLTFPTVFLDLPFPTAVAMVASYKHTYNRGPSLSVEAQASLRNAEQLLGDAIKQVSVRGPSTVCGAFVRLSTRSPKDAAQLDKNEFRRQLRRHRSLMRASRSGTPIPESARHKGLDCTDDEAFEANAQLCAYV